MFSFLLIDNDKVKQIDKYFLLYNEKLNIVKQEKERIIEKLNKVLIDSILTY